MATRDLEQETDLLQQFGNARPLKIEGLPGSYIPDEIGIRLEEALFGLLERMDAVREEAVRANQGGYTYDQLRLRSAITSEIATLIHPEFAKRFWPLEQGQTFPDLDGFKDAVGKEGVIRMAGVLMGFSRDPNAPSATL